MKTLKTLLALSTFALASSAFAYTNPYVFGSSNSQIGLLPSVDFSINLGGGADQVVGPFGLRGAANVGFGSGLTELGANAALTFPFALDAYSPYLGVGVGFNSLSSGSASSSSTNVFGLLGTDFYLNNNGRIFVEAVPNYNLAGGSNAFSLGLTAGLKVNLN